MVRESDCTPAMAKPARAPTMKNPVLLGTNIMPSTEMIISTRELIRLCL